MSAWETYELNVVHKNTKSKISQYIRQGQQLAFS